MAPRVKATLMLLSDAEGIEAANAGS